MNGQPRGRRPAVEITDPQRRTLRALRRFIDHRGFPPTIKELADSLGISAPSAHDQVGQLVRKGFVKRESRKARGLTVVRAPADEVLHLMAVPIVGRVAAGQPILAEENIVGEVLVDSRVVRSGRCFALEVHGDSMIGAGIRDQDLVVVREQPVAESGDIVVALLDQEATVKRLRLHGRQRHGVGAAQRNPILVGRRRAGDRKPQGERHLPRAGRKGAKPSSHGTHPASDLSRSGAGADPRSAAPTPKYNPRRAQLNTFIARVVEHKIATLIEARKAGIRDYRRCPFPSTTASRTRPAARSSAWIRSRLCQVHKPESLACVPDLLAPDE